MIFLNMSKTKSINILTNIFCPKYVRALLEFTHSMSQYIKIVNPNEEHEAVWQARYDAIF